MQGRKVKMFGTPSIFKVLLPAWMLEWENTVQRDAINSSWYRCGGIAWLRVIAKQWLGANRMGAAALSHFNILEWTKRLLMFKSIKRVTDFLHGMFFELRSPQFKKATPSNDRDDGALNTRTGCQEIGPKTAWHRWDSMARSTGVSKFAGYASLLSPSQTRI